MGRLALEAFLPEDSISILVMKDVYLCSAYLAPVEYYAKLLHCRRAFVEQYDHYMKQTYRNRCVIAAADGPLALSIPTEKFDAPKCEMREVRISDHGHWRRLHWNALESAYRNSPFFDYYQDDFRPFYERKFEFLVDFNEALQELICGLIDMQPVVARTCEYKLDFSADEEDWRERIHPKVDWHTDEGFVAVPYYQVFEAKHGFLPNLSIVDLLFNMGPESLLVLRDAEGGGES